jgi:phosphoglycerate dehydrogenase-like enzyme
MATKIVFIPKQPDAILDMAKALTPPGFELVVVDQDTPEFYEAIKDSEYVMGLGRPIGGEFFRSAPKLKLVQLLSAGYDRVDIESARKAKVPVANNGGANAIAVSEHAIMLMMAALKRLVVFHNDVVAGKWRVGNHLDSRVFEMHGKTLGIIGLGNIGKKVARLAHAFNMNVLYYDIARLTEDQEDALGVRFVLFTELLQSADIVTLHVPLDDSTRNLIGARELGMMKKTAILVNTCRGPVVDEAALHKALTSGQILAAGLDVLVEEPAKPNHPLYALKNVTLTPHSAGPTWENWAARFRNGFDNIQRVAGGRSPKWVIPELLTPPGV